MLFLVGLSIIANDGVKFEIEESLLECSRYLLRKIDEIPKNKNFKSISLDYKSVTIQYLLCFFILPENTIFPIKGLDLDELLKLYKELDFKHEICMKFADYIFYLFYMQYDNFKNIKTDKLIHKKSKELLQKFCSNILISLTGSRRIKFCNLIIFKELLETTKYRCNIILYNSFKTPYTKDLKMILKSPNLNILSIKFGSNLIKRNLLKKMAEDETISSNIKNLYLHFKVSTNIDTIKEFNNLKYLVIYCDSSNKFMLNLPEMKVLSSITIISESSFSLNFSMIESLKKLDLIYGKGPVSIEFNLNKCFPNLETITIKNIDLNFKNNYKRLINICKELKYLKIVDISVNEMLSMEIINKLIEEIPQIIIRYELSNIKYPIISNDDIDKLFFYSEYLNITESYHSNYFSDYGLYSLIFENNIPQYDFLDGIDRKHFVKILYLTNLKFNEEMFKILEKFKEIITVIIKNVIFEDNDFYKFIDYLKYDIKNLRIYNCSIPSDELKIIKEIKYLEILSLRFNKESEAQDFNNLFGKIKVYDLQKLKVLNYITYDDKILGSQFNMGNRDIEIKIYKS